jgi:catechol 2,3-dioxygenase-like lactoylglutathione lyase family enzyme
MWKPSSDGPAVALEVEDFDEAIAHLKLKRHKVALLGEPFESSICRGAFILDPDGNKIGIYKRKTL